MLEIGKEYGIEKLGEAQGFVYVFIWGEGEYDEYRVRFTLIEPCDSNGEKFFESFEPNGKYPIAFFKIHGEVKVPIPVQKVTQLGLGTS